jgi:CelD/BcsL family acetyltransferase involved in cellulose biosynthesis
LTERRVADRELGTDNIPWDFLELKSAQADDPALQALLSHLGDRGCAVHSREGTPCWRLDLPETWEQYLGRLSHSHRKQLRRIERRYFDTGLAVLRSAVDEASLDRGLDVLIDLHQKRWRSREQPGCFADKRFAAFMVDAARAQLAAGDLRLHWLELAGTPIAAEYHLASGRAVYAYQSGIEPAALEFEPGRMITVALVRQAIAEGRQTYDFLRGNERYKAHFRAAPVQVANIRVAPPTATGRLRDTLWLAGDNLRNVIKAGLGQSPVSEAPHPV